MNVKGLIKTGEYFDSVTLMIVGRELSSRPGVRDAAVVMGTAENKAILKSSGLLTDELSGARDADLLISVQAADEPSAASALAEAEALLKKTRQRGAQAGRYCPKSLDGALKVLPDANLALVSVAGKHAGEVAMNSLRQGLHVMLFSDNVPLETEVALKTFAASRGLLVMGPDCGTAIINGVPLAFANAVSRGEIGIVAAAGTGLQEVSSIISNEGAGVSQAIGTGGRDVKKEVGGIMFLAGLEALAEDAQTQVIVLVSKPPHEEVLAKLAHAVQGIRKPVVAAFLGADPARISRDGMLAAGTLEEAALLASALVQGGTADAVRRRMSAQEEEIERLAVQQSSRLKKGQRYVRGLFSGGTFCSETQLIFREMLPEFYSNVPLPPGRPLADVWRSQGHTFVDLGEDAFTVGRPHPMIDFSLRNRRLLEEAKDPETAIILLDVVLGYGSNLDPAGELGPAIAAAREGRDIVFVASVTGTEKDPQVRSRVEDGLKASGVVVMPTNAAAAKLAARIAMNLASNS
ncbi:MAG TPA: FdrA family protein [Elusimicrobia bacterium]|nr:FdrA family protein [Elusimicrobiota bacterium]HBT61636.1 FdrA family protein [Elusimicrobiota bacterium]